MNRKLIRLSMVSVYKDTSYDTPQYGLHYIISDGYSKSSVERLTEICDDITYREHYHACVGEYPPVTSKHISYGIPGNEHRILFHNIPLSTVKRAGAKIAKVLNVVCICPYKT